MAVGRLLRRAGVVVSAGSLAAIAGIIPAQGAAAPGWRLTATVGPSADSTSLASFVVTSRDDAWLAATTFEPASRASVPVVEHWNGRSWTQAILHAPASFQVIVAFGAASGRDAWAFTSAHREALHWNGVTWKALPVPSWVVRQNNGGYDIAPVVFGPSDVLVFSLGAGSYAAHYNGRRWTRMRLPANVSGVQAVSRDDIWAQVTSASGTHTTSLVRWNGHAWRKLAVPRVQAPAGAKETVQLVRASGPDNLWLERDIQKASWLGTLYWQHWNGRTWSRLYPPHKVQSFGLTPDGHGGYWSVAYGGAPDNRPYFYHRSDGRWTRQAVPGTKTLKAGNVLNWALVPGTRSLLATGQISGANGSPDGGPLLAIWQYGQS